MMYKAFVKDIETKKLLFLEGEFEAKAKFVKELGQNGYSVKECEPKEVYDFILNETNASPFERKVVRKMWKDHIPLTRENFEKFYDKKNKKNY